MVAMDIVRLGPSDVALHGAMQALYADAFEDDVHYRGRPPDAAYLRRVLANELTIALVACKKGAVVGALTAYELQKLEQAQSEIYIYDLAVDANHRRQGIATRLINEVCAIGRARGAAVAYVQAAHDDQPATALYSKLGRREEVVHFDLSLS